MSEPHRPNPADPTECECGARWCAEHGDCRDYCACNDDDEATFLMSRETYEEPHAD